RTGARRRGVQTTPSNAECRDLAVDSHSAGGLEAAIGSRGALAAASHPLSTYCTCATGRLMGGVTLGVVPLALHFALALGTSFFHGRGFASQFEFGAGCKVLHVVAAVVRAGKHLAVVHALAAGEADRCNQSQRCDEAR